MAGRRHLLAGALALLVAATGAGAQDSAPPDLAVERLDDGRLRVAIKRIEGGVFSNYANERFRAGQAVSVMAPQGRFFSELDPGDRVVLLNLGPDEPFGGGVPGVDFPPADPATTGQVMEFRVVPRRGGPAGRVVGASLANTGLPEN